MLRVLLLLLLAGLLAAVLAAGPALAGTFGGTFGGSGATVALPSATVDFSALAPNQVAFIAVTVPGMPAGAHVTCVPSSPVESQLEPPSCSVQSSNVVTVRTRNGSTATTVDAPPFTLTFKRH